MLVIAGDKYLLSFSEPAEYEETIHSKTISYSDGAKSMKMAGTLGFCISDSTITMLSFDGLTCSSGDSVYTFGSSTLLKYSDADYPHRKLDISVQTADQLKVSVVDSSDSDMWKLTDITIRKSRKPARQYSFDITQKLFARGKLATTTRISDIRSPWAKQAVRHNPRIKFGPK
jgi:hypothetical protein